MHPPPRTQPHEQGDLYNCAPTTVRFGGQFADRCIPCPRCGTLTMMAPPVPSATLSSKRHPRACSPARLRNTAPPALLAQLRVRLVSVACVQATAPGGGGAAGQARVYAACLSICSGAYGVLQTPCILATCTPYRNTGRGSAGQPPCINRQRRLLRPLQFSALSACWCMAILDKQTTRTHLEEECIALLLGGKGHCAARVKSLVAVKTRPLDVQVALPDPHRAATAAQAIRQGIRYKVAPLGLRYSWSGCPTAHRCSVRGPKPLWAYGQLDSTASSLRTPGPVLHPTRYMPAPHAAAHLLSLLAAMAHSGVRSSLYASVLQSFETHLCA